MSKLILVFIAIFVCLPFRADAQSRPVAASAPIPRDASLSMFVQLSSSLGSLPTDQRNAFLKSSELSAAQMDAVLNAVGEVFELQNLEGKAARMRAQPNSDFTVLERSRGELLQTLRVDLETRLGADGWAKFNSFLRSIEKRMRVQRGLCDAKFVTYTFASAFQGESSVTALAVADAGSYAADSRPYAEATLRSPGNREITAKSPTSSFRMHTTAIAALPIDLEDGTYQSSFAFGELCGEDKAPRMYTDRVQ